MGSFTSAPKIPNDDYADEDVVFPCSSTWDELSSRCEAELSGLPKSISRVLIDVGQLGNDTIRIMQWNVLAQALAEGSDGFVKCPLEALTWQSRRWRLLAEMAAIQPDILCLQEVDHFRFFQKAFSSVGLDGVFCPKPDSPCVYIPDNNGPDGCALFVNILRYDILETKSRCLKVWKCCDTNQVAIFCKIRRRSDGAELWVATTHLKARTGPFLEVLRQQQGCDLLEFVKSTVDDKTPVLLAGDLNAGPTEPVHTVLKTGGFESVYCNQEPSHTTWTVREDGEHCKTLDYILYKPKSFHVQRLLQLPSEEDIGPQRVPSYRYPSDHFALVADLFLHSTSTTD